MPIAINCDKQPNVVMKLMPYTYTLPKSTSFTGTGLEGYSFGPLRQKDVDIYYIKSEKGHDTFMVSKKITRIVPMFFPEAGISL